MLLQLGSAFTRLSFGQLIFYGDVEEVRVILRNLFLKGWRSIHARPDQTEKASQSYYGGEIRHKNSAVVWYRRCPESPIEATGRYVDPYVEVYLLLGISGQRVILWLL